MTQDPEGGRGWRDAIKGAKTAAAEEDARGYWGRPSAPRILAIAVSAVVVATGAMSLLMAGINAGAPGHALPAAWLYYTGACASLVAGFCLTALILSAKSRWRAAAGLYIPLSLGLVVAAVVP